MQMNEYHEVVIVVGDIAGLACARRLAELGMPSSRQIMQDISGRLLITTDGKLMFGAFDTRSDCGEPDLQGADHTRGMTILADSNTLETPSSAKPTGRTPTLLVIRPATDCDQP